MAYKPSERRNTTYAGADLDIRPIMNLMVCLIPMLLLGAEFVKNAEIEVKLPPSSGGKSKSKPNDIPDKEKKKQLQFTVAITKEGFTLNALNVKLLSKKPKGKEKQPPTVPLKADGTHDFLGLRAKAKELQAEIKGKNFEDDQQVIITANKDIPYDLFIKTQDAITGEKDGDEIIPIFPTVTIGVALSK